MSSAVDTDTRTFQERAAQATRDLWAALDLGTFVPSRTKYLSLALAQAASEEAKRNAEFAARLRSIYEELAPAKKERTKKKSLGVTQRSNAGPNRVELIPIDTVSENELSAYGPPNAFTLQKLFGNHQLRLALSRHGVAALRVTVTAVEEHFPGTKPKKLTKAAIIDYIVEHVAGPGY